MYKTTILLIVIAVLCLGILLYLVPWQTRVDVTLNATKLDKDGNELGAAQIILQGEKSDYLFQPSYISLDVTIEGRSVNFNTDGYQNRSGAEIQKYSHFDYYYITLIGYDGQDLCWLPVNISPDLTRWMLYDFANETYYVASVNETDTAQSLWDYFRQ